MKRIQAIAAAALAASALIPLASCGSRTYSATVSGYVKSSTVNADGTQDGINGAEVLVYTVDPSADTTAVPLARTGSMTSGGNDGYWSHKIMWTTSSPLYGDEGDSGTVWVKIMRKGYFPRTAEVSGILSDASNVVPTIELSAIHSSELKGKVVNENGVGVDGVSVVLDLMSTDDTQADYAATTATTDGEQGVFTFTDIAWGDADSIPAGSKAIAADGTSATESCRLYIDDAAYYSDEYNEDDRASQAEFTITSDQKLDVRTTKPITVRSATFAVPIVKGRVVDSSGAGVNGVTMAIDLPITTNTAPDATVTTATLGGQAGWYQFEAVSWTNANPTHSAFGVYDDVTVANIYLDDGTKYSENDLDKPISIAVTSGATSSVPSDITVGDAEFGVTTVTGRVAWKDDTAAGWNGVTVYLELSDGSTVNTTTTTVTIGTTPTDGIFRFQNVLWTDTEPEASAGVLDTEQVRIYVQDDNYSSDDDSESPLILTLSDSGASDSADATASFLTVQLLNFACPSVTGKVTSDGTTGIAGVSVVLDLQSTATARDYTATTDKDGIYRFSTVAWSDETPDVSSKIDTEDVQISIDDTNYGTTAALPLQTITSDTEEEHATGGDVWTITAARRTRPEYSVTVTGTCWYRKTLTTDGSIQDTAAGGVNVVITTTDGSAGLQTNATSYTVQSGSDGTWSAAITWSRDPSYVPGSDAARTAGGDELPVTVAFTDPTYVWGAAKPYTILSWSDNNIVNGVSTAMQ